MTVMFPQRREAFDRFVLEALIEPPGAARPAHRHERAHIFMVFAGVVFDESAQGVRAVRPGAMLVRPAGVVHANHYGDEGASLIWIDLAPSLTDTFQPLYGSQWASALLTFPMLRQLPEQILSEIAALDAVSKRILPGLIEQLLGFGARAAAYGNRPEWLSRAVEMLDRHCAEGISVAELAQGSGVSPSRLVHGFRELVGCSIGHYLRELRVERGARALRDGDESIAAIAVACGFADQAHFSRTFKELRGVTPNAYRRSTRLAAQPK